MSARLQNVILKKIKHQHFMIWHLILPLLLSLTVYTHSFLELLVGGGSVEVFLRGTVFRSHK